MQTLSVSKINDAKTAYSSRRLVWLIGGLTLLTAVMVALPPTAQDVATIGLLVGLTGFVLRFPNLALSLALAYLPLGVRLNVGGENLSLLLSFWLFDLICLQNIVWLLRHRDWHWLRLRPGVGLFLGLFSLAVGLSTLFSINFGLSLRKLYDLGQYLAVFVAIVSTHRRYPKLSLHLLLEALLLSSAGTALLGTLEFYSQFAWASPYLARDYYLPHTAALFEGTRSYNLLKDGLDNWILINGPLRAFGSLLTPAGLGQYLLLGVVILVIYIPLRQLRPHPPVPRLNWLLVWLTAELLFLAIFFTYARASWFVAVAIVVAAGILWLRHRAALRWPTRSKIILALAVLLLPLGLNLVVFSLYHYNFTPATPAAVISTGQILQSGLLVPIQVSPPLSQTVTPTPPSTSIKDNPNFAQNQQQPLVRLLQIFNLQDHSTQDRLAAWKYGFRAFPDHPLFGRGPGTFGLGGLSRENIFAKPGEITPAIEQASIQAHNMYLNFLVEDGILGLACYLILIGYTLFRLLLLRPATIAALATKLILIIWLIAFSWDEFFDNLFLYTKNGALLFVVLGLAAILTAPPRPPYKSSASLQ